MMAKSPAGIEGTLDTSYFSSVEGVSDWSPKTAPPQETVEASAADDQHGASSSKAGK